MRIKQLIKLLINTSFLISCASTKQPFEIKKTVISEKIIEDNNGKLIELSISNNKKITFLNMYYNDQKAPIKILDNNTLSSFFKENTIEERSINVHVNPAEEFGNTPNKIKVKPPININENQVLVSYKKQKKIEYKVIDLSNK